MQNSFVNIVFLFQFFFNFILLFVDFHRDNKFCFNFTLLSISTTESPLFVLST
uniref:Uncharacterized protein n=1 Tax=Anguilla anguilla TaxID=7936 RepID=A0A0E9PU18_ANGAN